MIRKEKVVFAGNEIQKELLRREKGLNKEGLASMSYLAMEDDFLPAEKPAIQPHPVQMPATKAKSMISFNNGVIHITRAARDIVVGVIIGVILLVAGVHYRQCADFIKLHISPPNTLKENSHSKILKSYQTIIS